MAAYADLSYDQMEQLGSHGSVRMRGQVVQSAGRWKWFFGTRPRFTADCPGARECSKQMGCLF
jgi:hypothetical protein